MDETYDVQFSVDWTHRNGSTFPLGPIWKRRGNYGRGWLYAELQIEPADKVAHFTYEVQGEVNARSTVSIDDIQLIDGPCVASDSKSIACTFEDENTCGYTPSNEAYLPWTRTRTIARGVLLRPSDGQSPL